MSDPTFEPTSSAFTHRFAVQPSDIDELGHANNVVWVRWVNEAALAHAAHVGMGPEGCRALKLVWVVRRHDVSYLLPAFNGEQLEARTWPHTLKGATSLRRTIITRAGTPLLQAETTWALLHAETGRPTRIPPQMLAAYGITP